MHSLRLAHSPRTHVLLAACLAAAPSTSWAQDGQLDLGFDPGSGADLPVFALARQPDGKTLVGGAFTAYDGAACPRITRVLANGQRDSSFDPGAGPDSFIRAIVLRADGTAVIAGQFTSYDGVPRNRIARIHSDGSLDASFDPGAGANSGIHVLAEQPDGRLLIGGQFTYVDGELRPYFARLHANGSLDTSYNARAGGLVRAIVVQPSGSVLIGGGFTLVNGVPRRKLARLFPDGSLDTSFDPGEGTDSSVNAIVPWPDGRAWICGAFWTYQGVLQRSVVRILNNGSRDTSFDVGVGMGWSGDGVYAAAAQPDGKLVIAGHFSAFNGVARRGIARLETNGSVDTSFDSGAGADHFVQALVLQPDGRALIGGSFSNFDGVSRSGLARLVGYSWYSTAYCTAGTSTNGCAPTVSSTGTPSVAGASGFTLDVSGVDGQRQGLIFYGIGGRKADAWAPGSTSVLCVKAPMQRMIVASTGGASGQCDGALSTDWLAYVSANPTAVGAPFVAGVTVSAQGWFRDPPAPKSTSLSNALEFVTAP
jgi:uncharacterized delta-60 repeat protein